MVSHCVYINVLYITLLEFAVKNQELYTVMDVTITQPRYSSLMYPTRYFTRLLSGGYFAVHQSNAGLLSEFIVKYATEPRSRPSENRLTSHTVFTVLESGYRAVEECAVMTDLVPDFKRLRGLLGGSTGVPEF